MNVLQTILSNALSIPGLTTQEECKFLFELALSAPSGWFVELGSFKGRSGYVLCEAAKRRNDTTVLLIDNFSHHQFTNKEILRHNLFEMGFSPLIVDGDSSVIPKIYPAEQRVGLLFIDSEHTKRHFNKECAAWLPKVASKGVVVCHDYGGPNCPEITNAIDDNLKKFPRIGLVRRLIAFEIS
jgi:predicted O-methyltransferase YrrM